MLALISEHSLGRQSSTPPQAGPWAERGHVTQVGEGSQAVQWPGVAKAHGPQTPDGLWTPLCPASGRALGLETPAGGQTALGPCCWPRSVDEVLGGWVASWRHACLCSVKAAAGWELSPSGWGVSGWQPAAGSSHPPPQCWGQGLAAVVTAGLGWGSQGPCRLPPHPGAPGHLPRDTRAAPCFSSWHPVALLPLVILWVLRALRGGERALPSRSSQHHTPCPSQHWGELGEGHRHLP